MVVRTVPLRMEIVSIPTDLRSDQAGVRRTSPRFATTGVLCASCRRSVPPGSSSGPAWSQGVFSSFFMGLFSIEPVAQSADAAAASGVSPNLNLVRCRPRSERAAPVATLRTTQ